MKDFSIKLAAFLLGLVLLLGACSLYYELRVERRDVFRLQHDAFAALDHNVEVLFLGDSHMGFDIRNRVMPRSYFNFGYSSENWRDMFIKARYALQMQPGIHTIVVPADYHSLSGYRERPREFGSHLYYTRYQEICDTYPCSLSISFRQVITYYLPLFRERSRLEFLMTLKKDVFGLLGIASKKPRPILFNESLDLILNDGLLWMNISENDRHDTARARTEVQLGKPLITEELVSVMDEFFAWAQQRDISVVGIHFPLSLEYQEAAEQYDLEQVRKLYRQRPFATIYDYEHLFDDYPEYFHDEDHLTEEGAEELTKRLLEDLSL